MALFNFFKNKNRGERTKGVKDPKELKSAAKKEIIKGDPEKETSRKKEDIGKGDTSVNISRLVTEKSTILEGKGVYTFKIDPRFNKSMVKEEINRIYKNRPEKVNIVKIPSKKIISRGRLGIKKGFKKAIVYMGEGVKLE